MVAGADGVANVDITDSQIPLCGENSIIGRSIVVSVGRLLQSYVSYEH